MNKVKDILKDNLGIDEIETDTNIIQMLDQQEQINKKQENEEKEQGQIQTSKSKQPKIEIKLNTIYQLPEIKENYDVAKGIYPG